MKKTIEDLITCAKRELSMRKKVYKGRVERMQMTQDESDHEIECMVEILRILEAKQSQQQKLF